VRLEITGAQAKLCVNDMREPSLVMNDLKSGIRKGGVGLEGSAYFSNFEIRETPPVAWERHEPTMPAATITKWSLSPSLDGLERDLERPLSKSEAAAMKWQDITAEPPGFVVINRYRRSPEVNPTFANAAEVSALLSQPDRTKMDGQRDHALLSFLYNTGARIQEALDLRPQDLHLKSPSHVTLMGKGRKERISPIWPETAKLLDALLCRRPRRLDEPLFVNRYGAPLTASGFRFRLRQYVRSAAESVSTLSKKRVTPHVFRHSTAVHLVAAGVDVTVIRSWLGHAQLDTTNHYAQASLETKRKALEQVDPKCRPTKPPRWKRDTDLLGWLDSL